jgi:hypothetical protein
VRLERPKRANARESAAGKEDREEEEMGLSE